MKVISNIKDGLRMSKDKAVGFISSIGNFLKSKQNRVVSGIVILGLGIGLGGSLITSGYVKLPQ